MTSLFTLVPYYCIGTFQKNKLTEYFLCFQLFSTSVMQKKRCMNNCGLFCAFPWKSALQWRNAVVLQIFLPYYKSSHNKVVFPPIMRGMIRSKGAEYSFKHFISQWWAYLALDFLVLGLRHWNTFVVVFVVDHNWQSRSRIINSIVWAAFCHKRF